MSRSRFALAVVAGGGVAASSTYTSHAPPKLTVGKTFGKVAGWSIG